MRDAGATFRLNNQVVGFERSPSGDWFVRVKESAGGKTISKTYVAKSLVIASGGFTADRKRCARIDPRLMAEVHTTANPYGTVWDGATSEILDVAQAVGAAVTDGFGLQLLPFWGGRLLDYDGGDIYVNAAGERFVNESLPWKVITDKMLDLEDRSCWVITDARSHKGAMLGLKLINGIVYKADTIEEMASRMHVPSPVLKKTIETYNKSVDKGYDEITGKTIFISASSSRLFTSAENQSTYTQRLTASARMSTRAFCRCKGYRCKGSSWQEKSLAASSAPTDWAARA